MKHECKVHKTGMGLKPRTLTPVGFAKLVDCPFVGGAGGRRVLLPYTVYKAISGIYKGYTV